MYDDREEWYGDGVESAFRKYEELRRYTRKPNSEIVRSVLEDVNGNGPNLEIGCGDGELYRLVPNLKTIPTDFSKFACRLFKNRTGIDPVVADARKLPVKDERFGMIVGYSVVDVIPYKDYPKLFEEVKRTLESGGYFIHFLDLQPNIMNIVDNLQKENPDSYIFPWCPVIKMPYIGDVKGWNGLQLMDKSRFSAYFSSLEEFKRPLIEFLARDPFKTLTYLKVKEDKPKVSCSISEDASPFCETRFDFVEYFREKLRKMEGYDFKIVKDEIISKTTPNPIDEKTVVNKVGTFVTTPDGGKVHSEIHVFISEKL